MKFQIVTVGCVFFTSAILALPAQADPFEDLEACKSIAAEAERLACFEAGYDQLRAAGMTADSVLKSSVAEAEVPAAEETAGGSSRRFKFFGRKSPEDDAAVAPARQKAVTTPTSPLERDDDGRVTEVTATVIDVRRNALDHTTVTLSNGQKWRSNESRSRVKSGEPVRIWRTRFGGYFLRQGRGAAVRVKRVDEVVRARPTAVQVADGSARVEKEESLLSRLNPFDRKAQEAPAIETSESDPDFGKPASADTSEEAFGRTSASKNSNDGEQKTLTQTVASVLVDPYDKFIITLANGQVWRQIEGRLRVREGDTIFIKETFTGSRFLQVGGKGVSVRVRRVS